ncbi:beta-glucan synthesis-associated [Trametes meyenii]|nr:beta-glucan synthesis-associated [Trametes meyenii]
MSLALRHWVTRALVRISLSGCLALNPSYRRSAGYPIANYFVQYPHSFLGGFNLGGINATGQVPSIPGNWGLIDRDTAKDAHTLPDFHDGKDWQLIFSDEFNADGNSFDPGGCPYSEAVDLHYWQTNNMEWYDPAAITTKDGVLVITLGRKDTHDLHFQGGIMLTWNKFFFTGGMVLASVSGRNATQWPYSYGSCDVGTVHNQTVNHLPAAATVHGDPGFDGIPSLLPGQRLFRCTCPGESHPGPVHADGTYVGRSAPEIDIFEAQPFNEGYVWFNTPDNLIILDLSISTLNSYIGGVYQQATSVVTETSTLSRMRHGRRNR